MFSMFSLQTLRRNQLFFFPAKAFALFIFRNSENYKSNPVNPNFSRVFPRDSFVSIETWVKVNVYDGKFIRGKKREQNQCKLRLQS